MALPRVNYSYIDGRYEIVPQKGRGFLVNLDGLPIGEAVFEHILTGAPKPIPVKGSRRSPRYYARLLGYDNFTWIGTGKTIDIARALVDHELDQRVTNMNRGSTKSPYKGWGQRRFEEAVQALRQESIAEPDSLSVG